MLFRRKRDQELRKAACTEYATGLPNMYGFEQEMEKIKQTGRITDYCAYYIDIARMGRINNRFGKQGGDRIIKLYAEYLLNSLEKDEVLGRLGSDFFVALIQKKNTRDFLKRIQSVPLAVVINGQSMPVSISAVAGVYEIVTDTITSGEILSKTSAAASYAKNALHVPYVFMDDKLEKQLTCSYEMEEEIMSGLEQGEFEPFYQPKVDSRNNSLIGAEALARWKHNGRYVPPDSFIPEMERSSLICSLDFHILDCVCRDISRWLAQGYPAIEVSVNFSRKNLSDPELAKKIQDVLDQYDIPKNTIQIEITETINEYSMLHVRDLVDQLNDCGISSAIDDFGSGSSSITLLKYANFKDLKIDKSFVAYSSDMEKQLLEDIIRMAKNMQMNVIAEGVERKEQIKELNEMGCFKIQGFYYDKPLPREQFESDWLKPEL